MSINIHPLSTTSLFLQIGHKNQPVASATGFVVKFNTIYYLVTNWHVVTGRHPISNKPILQNQIIPNELNIIHHSLQRLGSWIPKVENLFNPDGTSRWLEHLQGRNVDIILLPLVNLDNNIKIYPFDLNLADADMKPEPAMPVSIIGYPLGLATGERFPIWKTGHIASDPDLDYYKNKPAFLIDATTREGMSGSPVVLRANHYETRAGEQVITTGMRTLFLGVYSGRIGGDSELGLVWRPRLINEIARDASII